MPYRSDLLGVVTGIPLARAAASAPATHPLSWLAFQGGIMAELTEVDYQAACEEWFLTHHSGWSVPRFCHRPEGHKGLCCGPGNGHDHLNGCTDAVTPRQGGNDG